MKIIDFLKDCQLDNSEKTEFKQIHPKQLISEEIPISI